MALTQADKTAPTWLMKTSQRGQTQRKIFWTQPEVDEAIADGWHGGDGPDPTPDEGILRSNMTVNQMKQAALDAYGLKIGLTKNRTATINEIRKFEKALQHIGEEAEAEANPEEDPEAEAEED